MSIAADMSVRERVNKVLLKNSRRTDKPFAIEGHHNIYTEVWVGGNDLHATQHDLEAEFGIKLGDRISDPRDIGDMNVDRLYQIVEEAVQ